MTRKILIGLAGTLLTMSAAAQTAPASGNPVDVRTAESVMEVAKTLLPKAMASPNGMAQARLESYPGHTTQLTVRTKNGEVEEHLRLSDWFIVEEGEATVRTGGTIVDPKEVSPGQIHGTRMTGATEHQVHKGDVVHISPGVPHQMMVPAGKPFIYYVVKVDQPKQ